MNNIDEEMLEKFKEEILKCIDRRAYSTKACQDSSKEYVILKKASAYL